MNIGGPGITALIGKNGSGKSSLLGLLARMVIISSDLAPCYLACLLTGMRRPDSGRIEVAENGRILTPSHLSQFQSFCPQSNLLFTQLTVMEHCSFYQKVHPTLMQVTV